MTVSNIDREGLGDTTKGKRTSPTFGEGGEAISGRQVGTPYASQANSGNGKKTGSNEYVPTSDFGAPKPGRSAGD